MAPSKRAPKPNVSLRRARRDLEHRRSERSFLWWFWGGWLGLLFARIANRSEHEQQARLEARHRRRRDPEPTARADESEVLRTIADSPHARDRKERATLRDAARRRRLIRTILVVGGLTLLSIAYMVLRVRLRR